MAKKSWGTSRLSNYSSVSLPTPKKEQCLRVQTARPSARLRRTLKLFCTPVEGSLHAHPQLLHSKSINSGKSGPCTLQSRVGLGRNQAQARAENSAGWIFGQSWNISQQKSGKCTSRSNDKLGEFAFLSSLRLTEVDSMNAAEKSHPHVERHNLESFRVARVRQLLNGQAVLGNTLAGTEGPKNHPDLTT
jgi:hypothetical protein